MPCGGDGGGGGEVGGEVGGESNDSIQIDRVKRCEPSKKSMTDEWDLFSTSSLFRVVTLIKFKQLN